MEKRKVMNRRWDPIIKLTHWGVAGLIICNALIVGEGSITHIYAGYFLAGLLVVRLLWGFVGPASARFASFPPRPRRAIAHIGDLLAGRKQAHVSHNPLGALMAYALWACLSVLIASGIAMAGPPPKLAFPVSVTDLVQEDEHETDERSDDEYREHEAEEREGDEVFEEVHEVAVNLLYLLIFLHILGVVFETARSGRRTVISMLPGGK